METRLGSLGWHAGRSLVRETIRSLLKNLELAT